MKFKVNEDKNQNVLKVKVTLPKFTGKNHQGCRDATVKEHLIMNKINV